MNGNTTRRLISWNVNGLRAVHKKGFLDWLRAEDPDICCLQETKAHPDQLPAELRAIPGYCCYYLAASRPGYSGVALISKTPPLDVRYGIGVEEFDQEGRVIVAEYPEFVLLTTYFPNGGMSEERLRYKLAFYEAYLEFLLSIRHRPLIVCGDVNTAHKEIDIARPKENLTNSGFMPIERAWLDKLVAHGFHDTFRLFNDQGGHYTWWDQRFRSRERNVGWRIDYFFVNDHLKDRVRASHILADVQGSDHCPIRLEIEV